MRHLGKARAVLYFLVNVVYPGLGLGVRHLVVRLDEDMRNTTRGLLGVVGLRLLIVGLQVRIRHFDLLRQVVGLEVDVSELDALRRHEVGGMFVIVVLDLRIADRHFGLQLVH